jgi:methionine-S-sulfoxide reductase
MKMIRFVSLLVLIFTAHLALATDSRAASNIETAILAGGCFWCTEADFEKLDGVIEAVSGYAGGHTKNPTYKQVSSGGSGHIEVVKVTYDADKIKYSAILDHFWRTIDPTRNDGQFCDTGPQYRPAIFYKNDGQKKQVLASARRVEKTKPFKAPLKVEFIKAGKFYPAEDYHQDYYKKNTYRYKLYRYGCGRDARIKALWSK